MVDDLNHDDFAKGLEDYDLDIVGVSCYTHSLQMFKNGYQFNLLLLEPQRDCDLGGPHPIMFPGIRLILPTWISSVPEMGMMYLKII